MAIEGLLINYEYCTGCYSCEVACRNEKELPLDAWGIKLTEIGPWELEPEKWEWDYVPVPTDHCDLCVDRVAEGKKPACAHHCLAQVMEFGTLQELAKRARELKGTKSTIFIPRSST
jgi:Fe-S-cluster-containing dehydrogenase component